MTFTALLEHEEPEPVAVPREPCRFWLVQRLQPAWKSNARGFDRFFELDYMGNSYFEFGAVPRALQRLRSTGGDLVIREIIMTRESISRIVYFVGPAEELDDKIEDFKTWLTPGWYQRTEEHTSFHAYFVGRDSFGDPLEDYHRTVAWWSLNDNIFWTLRSDIAAQIVQAVAPRPTT